MDFHPGAFLFLFSWMLLWLSPCAADSYLRQLQDASGPEPAPVVSALHSLHIPPLGATTEVASSHANNHLPALTDTSAVQQSPVPHSDVIATNRSTQSRQSDVVDTPFTYRGTCDVGLTYNIDSAEKLESLSNELACIYALGHAPHIVPKGFWNGNVLSVGNTELVNDLGELGWAGKLSLSSQCRDSPPKKFTFILNLALGSLILPALTYIGHFVDPLGELSFLEDGRPSLFCDYTVRWEDVCPNKQEYKHFDSLGTLNSILFGNASYDMLRMVGTTQDGGWIMLGRSIYRDINNPNKGSITSAWWYVTAYDEEAFGGLPTQLGPLTTPFSYTFEGIPAMIERLSPLDDLPFDPVGTAQRFLYYTFLMPYGLPSTGAAAEHYEEYPMAGEPLLESDKVIPLVRRLQNV